MSTTAPSLATTLNPYLNFDGNTREAMTFYAEALGGKLELMTVGDSPMPSAPEHKDRILHSTLTADNVTLMAADTQPGQPAVRGNQVYLSLNFPNYEEQTRVWERLSAGGKIEMPLGELFFGRFGVFTDKFGISWMLHCQPQST